MMKYFILTTILFSQLALAELSIKLEQPQLLLQQISGVDLGITPKLHDSERQFQQLINDSLKAENYLSLLNQLNAKQKIETMSAAMAYLVGQLALQQQQPKIAAQYFEQAIKRQPNYGKAYHGLGLTQLQLKQSVAATMSFSKALQLGVRDPQLYSYLGYGYIQSKNFHSAVVAYQQAKLFNPNNQQLNQALLYAYTLAGQSEAALSLLEQMLVDHQDDKSLWLHRANALLNKQQYILAIASLEAAIRLGENNQDNLALAAQLQLQHGSVGRAQQLYSRIWRNHNNPTLVLEAVEYLMASNQLNSAKNLLKKMKLRPKSPAYLHSQLAYLSGRLAQLKGSMLQAAKAFERSIRFNAVNGQALLALAQVKRAQQHSHQAQMLLLRASALDQVKLAALTEHADLMMSLGRYAKALTLLQQAASYAPQEHSITENIKTLRRMISQGNS